MPEYKLPDVGEGLTEAEIVVWKVAVGDTVAINDVVVEIETAKSLVELPSPYAGVVSALLVEAGQTVEVGTPIIAIGEPAAAGADPVAAEPPAAAPVVQARMEIDLSNPAASGGGEGESLVGRNKAERGPMRRPRRGSASPSTLAGAATQMQVQGAFSPGGAQSQDVVEVDEPAVPATAARVPTERVRALAKPPVRKLAKDLGVDLAELSPTGPHGTISRADVEAAAASLAAEGEGSPAPSGPSGPSGIGQSWLTYRDGETREPIKGVRKMMGEAMVRSAFTIPHVTEWVTVDVTRTIELVERLRSHRDFRDLRVSPLLVVARAAMLAMRRTPEINSTWDDAAGEVVFKHVVNLGIAAATPRGLVVPNVKEADRLSLADLARAFQDLADTARAGRTQPAEMSGGTFTITNVGPFGVDGGTPIINPGESAILCLGAAQKRPWVLTEDGVDRIEVRHVMQLSLSFDHRHIDGEKGSRFLADIAGVLEDPGLALLF